MKYPSVLSILMYCLIAGCGQATESQPFEATPQRLPEVVDTPTTESTKPTEIQASTNSSEAIPSKSETVSPIAMMHADPARSNRYNDKGPQELKGVKWSSDIPANVVGMTVAHNKIFVGTINNKILCLNLSNGDILWQFQTGGIMDGRVEIWTVAPGSNADKAGLKVEDQFVEYAGSAVKSKRDLLAGIKTHAGGTEPLSVKVKRKGEIIETQVQPGSLGVFTLQLKEKWGNFNYTSVPAVYGDLVIFGAGDGFLYAVNQETGKLVWSYRFPFPDAVLHKLGVGWGLRNSPVIVDGTVYIAAHYGRVFAVDALTGKKKWSFIELGRRNFIKSSPAVWKDELYYGHYDGKMVAINRHTGKRVWQSIGGLGSAIANAATDETLAYFASSSGAVIAMNKKAHRRGNGKKLVWVFPKINPNTGKPVKKLGRIQDGVTIGDNGLVYMTTQSGSIYAIDRETGKSPWKFKGRGSMNYSPCLADGVLYASTSSARVYAIDAKTGDEIWEHRADKRCSGSPVVHKGQLIVGGEKRIWLLH